VFHTGSLFHPEFSDIVSVHVRTQTSETNNHKCSPVFHTGSLFHPEFSDIVSVHVRTQTSETNNHNEVC
jgi:hypothetical protein